jgi:hypothetical protein
MNRVIQEEVTNIRKAAILNGVYLEPPVAGSTPMAADHQKLPNVETSQAEVRAKEQLPQQQQLLQQQQQLQQQQKYLAKMLPKQASSSGKVLVLPSFPNQQQQLRRVNSLPTTKAVGGFGPGSTLQRMPVQSQRQRNLTNLQRPHVVTSTVVLGKPLVVQQQQQHKAVVVTSTTSLPAVVQDRKVQDPAPTSSEKLPNRTEVVDQQQQVQKPSGVADQQVVVTSGQLQSLVANQKTKTNELVTYVVSNGTLRPLNDEYVRLNPQFKQIYEQQQQQQQHLKQQQQIAANAPSTASRATLIRPSGASNGNYVFIY